MKVTTKVGVIFGAQKIKIDKNRFISVNDDFILPPMTIEPETCIGFFVLDDLAPMFKHMKCWDTHGSDECQFCPVKHDGACGIMVIKEAVEAEKKAIKRNIRRGACER